MHRVHSLHKLTMMLSVHIITKPVSQSCQNGKVSNVIIGFCVDTLGSFDESIDEGGDADNGFDILPLEYNRIHIQRSIPAAPSSTNNKIAPLIAGNFLVKFNAQVLIF